jgi:hypothetical protein
MSAWPVSDREIDCLAYWISTLGLSKRDKTSIGRELRKENYRSLRARYGWWRDEYQKAPTYHYTEPRSTAKNGVTYDPYDLDQALKLVSTLISLVSMRGHGRSLSPTAGCVVLLAF